MLIHLLEKKYVKPRYQASGHQNSSPNVYLEIGPFANNLLNLSLEAVTSGEGPHIRPKWLKPAPKSVKRKAAPTSKKDAHQGNGAPSSKKQKTLTSHFTTTASGSVSKKKSSDDWDEMYESDGNLDPIELSDDDNSIASGIEQQLEEVEELPSDREESPRVQERKRRSAKGKERMLAEADAGPWDADVEMEMDSEGVGQIWSRSLLDDMGKYSQPPTSTSRTRSKAKAGPSSKAVPKPKPTKCISTEIIELSD